MIFKIKITIDDVKSDVSLVPEDIEDYIKSACRTGERGFVRAMWDLGIFCDLEVTKVTIK